MHIVLCLYHRTPQHGQYLSIRFVAESIFKSRLALRSMWMLRYLKDMVIQF
jgi:hypothetical protein